MTQVAFLQNIAYEYIGTEYLASVLEKSGHQVELFLGNNSQLLVREAARFNPDLVGFSCTTGIHRWAIDVATKIKEIIPNAKTIFGGSHPTFFPEVIYNDAVDIVCIGEGELVITELADRFGKGEDFLDIENLWIKQNGDLVKNNVRPLIEDLDTLPFPDRRIYYDKYPFLNRSQKAFFAGSGCPFSCSFCFNHALKEIYKYKGNFIRLRSPQNLINEIIQVKNDFGLRTVYLQDDTILFNRKWLIEFLEIYRKEVNLPFVCLVRADLVDEEIVSELKSSGCHGVFFGVETGDGELRNRLLKKNISDEQIIEAARLLKKYKIRFRTYNILGLPGETLEQSFKTVDLNIKIKTDYPWCSLFFPYPKTELGEYAQSNGLIGEDVNRFSYSFFYRSVIKSKYRKEISNLQKLFFYAVKFPLFFPLVKLLIRIKENIIFDTMFLFSYAVGYIKSENLTIVDLAKTAKYNARNFF